MLGYLGFRFVVEFIKPRETHVAGLSMIQTACLIGAGVCLWQLRRSRAGEAIVQREPDGTQPTHA
jgi:hypothetical protein